jgi:hypothetical protein
LARTSPSFTYVTPKNVDDLDPFEGGGLEAELGTDFRLAEHVVVDAVTVDEQQDPAVVVAGLAEPARPEQAEVAIVTDVHAAYIVQHVGQRPVAVAGDVLGRDERHRRGCPGDRLAPLRRPEHSTGIDAHQPFERHLGQRLRRSGGVVDDQPENRCGNSQSGHINVLEPLAQSRRVVAGPHRRRRPARAGVS